MTPGVPPSAGPVADPVVRAEGLWKRYGFPLVPALRSAARRLAGRPPGDDGPWALNDLNLEIRAGETVGILGRNGAGKSTLLKALAGVTPPTRGRVEVAGRLFPMIELNAGLHPELTGRENIRLLGAIHGLRREELAERLPAIEAFCELGEWLDRPVRKYSSGMLARLGFAVAMNVRADILLVDEVLAVGDDSFRAKCFKAMEEKRAGGLTTLFVSHSVRQIMRLCDRVVMMDAGRIVADGDPVEVAARYFREVNRSALERACGATPPRDRPGSGAARIVRTRVLDESGRETDALRTGASAKIVFEVDAPSPVRAIASLKIRGMDQLVLLHCTSFYSAPGGVECREGAGVVCEIASLPLAPGVYFLDAYLGVDGATFDELEEAARIEIVSDDPDVLNSKGVCHARNDWSVRLADAADPS